MVTPPGPDCLLGRPLLEDILLLAEDGAALPAENVLKQRLPEELQEAGHVPAGVHLLQTSNRQSLGLCLHTVFLHLADSLQLKAVVNCAVTKYETFYLETEDVRVLEVDHLGHPLEVALHVGVNPAVDVVGGDPQRHYHVLALCVEQEELSFLFFFSKN